jgi:hypothetical protein
VTPGDRAVWKRALSERTYPGHEAREALAAIGILQEGFGMAITLETGEATP